MKKYILGFIFLFGFTFIYPASSFASWIDYSKYFEVDLDEKLPTLEELEKKYDKPDRHYYRKYEFHWNIGNVFDEAFRASIRGYGETGKRIKHEDEENLIKMLSQMPPEHYQYIGPYLHTLSNMPEKVLNMPGIKETKNKFPTRIAPELQNMENLEYLSPYLYSILMPEMWPGYKGPEEEYAPVKIRYVQSEYDPAFFENVIKKVPENNYIPGATPKPNIKSLMKTRNPGKNSPLTSADAKAFANTLDGVVEFGKDSMNILKLSHAKYLIDDWELENDKALPIPGLKDMVNPCQRLVQRVKLSGLELDFAAIVAKEGFDLKSWAYTCDKTIKAYRISVMNSSVLMTLINYKNNAYQSTIDKMDNADAMALYSNMQSILAMYKAPEEDVMEVRLSKEDLHKKFSKMKSILVDSPLIILY